MPLWSARDSIVSEFCYVRCIRASGVAYQPNFLDVKMKSVLFATVALSVLATAASAADLAPRYAKAPMMANPVYSWTGFYLGLNAGAASTNPSFNAVANGIDYVDEHTFFSPASRNTGFIGGGQVGYNYQSGTAVLGVEADAAWLDSKSSVSTIADPFNHSDGVAKFSESLDWVATLRARAGIAATPSLLLYVTGGLAAGGVNVKYSNAGGGYGALTNTVSSTDTKYGWAAGFGAEYALGANWSVKGEYLRISLADAKVSTVNLDSGLQGSVRVNQDLDVIRAGINYKFQ
jgi:outer membrane immunogenic protein